jgi:hypothetical protein
LKSAQANSSRDPISEKKKKPSQKRVGGLAQGIGLEFKPQYHKTIKIKKRSRHCRGAGGMGAKAQGSRWENAGVPAGMETKEEARQSP